MKNLLGLALIASLLSAPGALAQTTTPTPPKAAPPGAPAGSLPGNSDAQPGVINPPAQPAGSATVGGKAGSGVVHGAPGANQEGKGGAPNAAEMQKAWEAAAKVGPNHKLLEWFAGEWQAEVKDLSPGKEATDKGVMVCTLVHENRFLSMNYAGTYHGKPFTGGGTMGYSNNDKRFESTWVDSMSTTIAFMSGTMSADNKVLTMTGEMTDPMTGKKVSSKEVTTITGKDTYKSEFYMGPAKVMEIGYTRSKGGEKKDGMKEEKPKGK